MEVSVLSKPDDSDLVLFLAGVFRIGEIDASSVGDMVTKVSGSMQGELITRLDIVGHGSSSSFSIGNDEIDLNSFDSFYASFRTLSYKFDARGFVHLQQCQTGQATSLLIRLAQAVQVPVYAGTGDENPVYRFNWGHYVYASPDGGSGTVASRP